MPICSLSAPKSTSTTIEDKIAKKQPISEFIAYSELEKSLPISFLYSEENNPFAEYCFKRKFLTRLVDESLVFIHL